MTRFGVTAESSRVGPHYTTTIHRNPPRPRDLREDVPD